MDVQLAPLSLMGATQRVHWLAYSLAVAAIGCDAQSTGPSRSEGVIAFGECVSGLSQIVVARTDGGARRQITTNPFPSWFPAWSPTGDRIAYVYEAPAGMQIWVVNADGTNNNALFTLGNSLAPSWSLDGSRIAFAHKTNVADGFKIWLMDADGTNAHPLTPDSISAVDENVPRWSPDRQHLVFTANASGLYEIWVADVATGADRRALTRAYHDASLAANIEQKVPAWSPDGRMIAYWSGVEGTDPRPNLPRDVWVMNADGTRQRKVVSGDDPNWSPDAQTIIHSLGSPSGAVLGAVAPDGSNARTLFGVNACRPLQSSWRTGD